MDRVIREVEEDARSLFTETTRHPGSTIYGIGATSGKAIKNLGEFLITTVGEIRMYNRLRVIGAEMRNFEADLPVSHFRDILELQRAGDSGIPPNARRTAWQLILASLATNRVKHITSILLEWSTTEAGSIEVRLFLRLLTATKLCDWKINPADMSPTPKYLLSSDVRPIIGVNFMALVTSLVEKVPYLVHTTFSTRNFALLLSTYVFSPRDSGYLDPHGDETSFSLFFQSPKVLDLIAEEQQKYQELFFTFLRTAHTKDIQDVLWHLLRRFIFSTESYYERVAWFGVTSNRPHAYHRDAIHCLGLARRIISDHSLVLCPPLPQQLLAIVKESTRLDLASLDTRPMFLLQDTAKQVKEAMPGDQVYQPLMVQARPRSSPEDLASIHSMRVIITTSCTIEVSEEDFCRPSPEELIPLEKYWEGDSERNGESQECGQEVNEE